MASIRLEGLTKTYGATVALRPTDVSIAEGEFFTVLGPSGSGKTTLLRMLGGFVEPTGGRIKIGGRDVTDLPAHRRNLGVVFQSYALFPHITVRENVAFGLRMRGVARAARSRRAEETLALVGLEGFGPRYPAQLSGGQQQRVALARALVIEPDVLLLDEPLGALDLNLRKRMQRELRDLHQRLGVTFVYVTHDQDEALTLSDRIAVMSDGAILQVDEPEAIYDRPESAFVAAFLGDSNLLAGHVERQGTARAFRLEDGTAVPLAADGGADDSVALSIRPERLRVIGRGAEPPVVLSGTVEARQFRGASLTVTLRLAGGAVLDVAVPHDGRAAGAAVGEPLRVGFEPEDARLLRDAPLRTAS